MRNALRPLPLLEGIPLPEPIRAPARPRAQHSPKIAEAMQALQAAGELPANLRLVEIHRRICAWLSRAGYDAKRELPSRWTVRRYLDALEKCTDTLTRLSS